MKYRAILPALTVVLFGPIAVPSNSRTIIPPVAAQDFHGCELRPQFSTPTAFRYQRRGTRCEGYFPRPVSSSPFRILSYGTPSRDSLTIAAHSVVIQWTPAAAGDSVAIRASWRGSASNYQMDTRQSASTSQYVWPLDVVRAARLNIARFEILCWYRPSHSRTSVVYVPCQLGSSGDRTVPRPPQLALVVQEPINRVQVNAYAVDDSGMLGRHVIHDRVVGGGPYTVGSRVHVPLREISKPGTYRLVVSCVTSRPTCATGMYDLVIPGGHEQ